MQFMSQSTGWPDHIILAMAPLGILTAIVGAIRVGGPSWLRAIIGRAREPRAVAEAELMSSTSHEVCELWNGQEVVRVMGEGPIREFIIMVPEGRGEDGTKDQDCIFPQIDNDVKLTGNNKYLVNHGQHVRSVMHRRSSCPCQSPTFVNVSSAIASNATKKRAVLPQEVAYRLPFSETKKPERQVTAELKTTRRISRLTPTAK